MLQGLPPSLLSDFGKNDSNIYRFFLKHILFPALWIYLGIQGSEVSKENSVTDRSLWILIFFYGNQSEHNNILYMQITAITYDARVTFVHPFLKVSELGFGFPRMITPITSLFLLLEIWYGWTALLRKNKSINELSPHSYYWSAHSGAPSDQEFLMCTAYGLLKIRLALFNYPSNPPHKS